MPDGLIQISLTDVTVDFPVLGASRSFRSALLSQAIGGVIRRADRGEGVVVRALDSIHVHLHAGDRLGLIGPNGAGKTTLLRTMAGIYEPTSGTIRRQGRISPLLDVSLGMNPLDTGYECIRSIALHCSIAPGAIRERTEEIAAFTELGDFLHLPLRTYSSGMRMRLAFAVATSIDPEILLIDEGIGAGDSAFARKAAKRIDRLMASATSLALASHSIELIRSFCTTAIYLERGRIHSIGPVEEVLDFYARRVGQGAA